MPKVSVMNDVLGPFKGMSFFAIGLGEYIDSLSHILK
jgi:hypothetical protein